MIQVIRMTHLVMQVITTILITITFNLINHLITNLIHYHPNLIHYHPISITLSTYITSFFTLLITIDHLVNDCLVIYFLLYLISYLINHSINHLISLISYYHFLVIPIRCHTYTFNLIFIEYMKMMTQQNIHYYSYNFMIMIRNDYLILIIISLLLVGIS